MVKESVFITGNNTPVLVELFRENYRMSPKIDESEILILSRIYADGAHMFALGKKKKSLQESLYEENKEHIEHMSDDIYEKLAFIMIEEKISRSRKRSMYVARYVAVKDDEGKRIIIDKILEMIFGKEKEIEIKVKKGFV